MVLILHTCNHFAEAKIGEFEIALVVKEYILGFYVPVNKIKVVEVLKGEAELRSVELRRGFLEPPSVPQMGKHLTTDNVGHYEVDVAVVFQRPNYVDDEGKPDALEDLLLVQSVLHHRSVATD